MLERLRAAGVTIPPVVVGSILPDNGTGRLLGVVDDLAKPAPGPLPRERVARALIQAQTQDPSRTSD